MKKISRHDTASISQPPTKGPIALATPASPDHAPIARPRSSGMERRRDDREAPGDEERAGRALQRARGDERAGVRRDAAQQRRDDEAGEPADEDAASSEDVAEVAAEQEQRAERDEVAVERPLQAGDRQPESARIAGSATLTTVPSRNAIPEPRTAAATTQRPAGVP